MSSFKNFRKKEEVKVEAKTKEPSIFDFTWDLIKVINTGEKRLVEDEFLEVRKKYEALKDINFAANLLLKYSMYHSKCVEYSEYLFQVFNQFDSEFFILHFMRFCKENRIRFAPFLQYYNLGLMDSYIKYQKNAEKTYESHDLEILKLWLKTKNLSIREFYHLNSKLEDVTGG